MAETNDPPVWEERLRRFDRSGVRTSLLPVAGALGIESVGFTAVGDVLGGVVQQVGWPGYVNCGYYPGSPRASRTKFGSSTGGAGFGPYAQALRRGYGTALDRMRSEASAMGADGVVGVRVEHVDDYGTHEFRALGTAVGAPRSRFRPATPFLTDLSGPDVAKLLLAGWAPVSIAIGLAVGLRHDGLAVWRQSYWRAGNAEVEPYTDLVGAVRAEARRHFGRKVADAGADGAIVSSMPVRVWKIEAGEGHIDHAAQATIVGTTVARFADRPARTSKPLTIMPLRQEKP